MLETSTTKVNIINIYEKLLAFHTNFFSIKITNLKLLTLKSHPQNALAQKLQ